jgi:carbon storage regulator
MKQFAWWYMGWLGAPMLQWSAVALRVLRLPLAMLVLARKENQNIIIDGNIVVRVLRVGRDVVKIGIEAPLTIPVHREEIFNALKEGELKAPSVEGKS